MVKRYPGFHKRRYTAKLMQAAEQRLDREHPDIYPEMREHLRKNCAKRLAERFGERIRTIHLPMAPEVRLLR